MTKGVISEVYSSYSLMWPPVKRGRCRPKGTALRKAGEAALKRGHLHMRRIVGLKSRE
jgi:hypothetical protein